MKDLKKHFIKTFIIGAVLLAGIAILLNMVFDNLNLGRFDLTAGNVYKLSPSVEKILSGLEAPIEVTYYVSSSEKMPTKWKNLERDVIDKLEEIKLASKGTLNYTVFDPSAEEEKEVYEEQKQEKEDAEESSVLGEKPRKTISRKKIAEQLFEKGVIPFGVQSTERDEFAVKRIYSSLVLSYLDRKEDVIPEVRPELFGSLEYEIMSRIYKLISNKRPKIALYPSQPEIPPQYRRQFMQQPPPDMYSDAEQLLKNAGYDVTRTNIKQDDPIPEDINTMLLFVDQPLNDRQKFEIDKLVHKGTNIILAAQNFNFQIMPARGGTPGTFDVQAMAARLNVNPLFRNYGFEIDDKVFMDRSSAFIQVPVYQTRNMGFFQVQEQRYEPVTKPVIIKVNAENINTNISISNKISEIFYLYGSKINILDEIMEKDTLSVTTLFSSSSHSWTRESFGYRPVDTTEPGSEDFLKNQPLGVLVQGRFTPVYKDQDVPVWPVEPGEENNEITADYTEKIEGDAKPAKMIVYGGSNLFKNDVLKSVASHQALLMNSVDALTLGDELINIRSKNIVTRRVKETSTVGKAVSKAFVVWFPPLVFLLLGIYVTIRRKIK